MGVQPGMGIDRSESGRRVPPAWVIGAAVAALTAIGLGSYGVVATRRSPAASVAHQPAPSPSASTSDPAVMPTASPSVSTPSSPSPAARPVVDRVLEGGQFTDVIVAHKSVWSIAQVPAGSGASPRPVLYRLDPDGAPKATVHLSRFLNDITVDRQLADGSGLWLLVSAPNTTTTAAAAGCRAVARTGPARAGSKALLRLAVTAGHCPTRLIDVGPTDDEIANSQDDPSARHHVFAMAYAGDALWLSTWFGLRRVAPDTGVTEPFGQERPRMIAAGFGHLWAAVSDPERKGFVLRIDPRDGRTVARVATDLMVTSFTFGAGAVWAATESTGRPQPGAIPNDPNGAVLNIDPGSNRVTREYGNVGGADGPTMLSVDAGRVYACHLIEVSRIDAKTHRRDAFIVRRGDRPRHFTGCVAVDGAVWIGIAEFGLFRVDAGRADWQAKS